MTAPVVITEGNGEDFFALERLEEGAPVGAFKCRIKEYADYLREEAFRAQDDHVAQTWLLWERETGAIAAYMSLIADTVRLSTAEKELHRLNYPFKTIPAVKIAKLAVAEPFRQRYKGLGTYMIFQANLIARREINPFIAACYPLRG
jgi:hypothetical protein